ncbi:MAG: branched-chain amino acid ABC transporter permease [Planctomycetaceae bacterium]|nr:branched-chain amino acid ABC transporter permease [Planctomycetaceae bacterium]
MSFDNVIESGRRRDTRLGLFFAGLFILFGLLPLADLGTWGMHIVILVMMYTSLAGAWSILGGYTGQFSVGHSAFFGVAGYTMGIMMARGISGPWGGAAVGVILAMILACLVGVCTARLKGIFFTLTTFALAEILRKLSLFQDNLTGGPLGLSLVLPGVTKTQFYYVALAMMASVFLAMFLLERSRFGFYCQAIRENEDAARATGINTARIKLQATVLSAFFTGLGGAFYAAYIGVIEPDVVFSFNLSIKIIILAIIGGSGTLIGPILGAAIVIVPEEIIRGSLGGSYAGVSGIAYGLILIVVILLKPNGVRSLLAFAIPHKRD